MASTNITSVKHDACKCNFVINSDQTYNIQPVTFASRKNTCMIIATPKYFPYKVPTVRVVRFHRCSTPAPRGLHKSALVKSISHG